MSKNNQLILLATALLGVLLYVILGIVGDVSISLPETDEPSEVASDVLAAPLVSNQTELRQFLHTKGADSDLALESYLNWLAEFGYTDFPDVLLAEGQVANTAPLREEDDASLLSLAGEGDTDAMQMLATRSFDRDPLDAANWYRNAAMRGSVYAMLRLSDLMETFADPKLAEFNTDPVFATSLQELRDAVPSFAEEALRWSIAAATVGGQPALSDDLVARLRRQSATLDEPTVLRVCNSSQRLVLELAAERRTYGGLTLTTEPPAMFVSATETIAEVIPCQGLIVPFIDTNNCNSNLIQVEQGKAATLWVCNTA
ncbi:MAG: hypothetical protein ACR2P6_09195 [Gammaproteobacteria bacterium]